VFVESPHDVVNVSRGGQLGLQNVLAGVLQRVEKGPKGARRLFPVTRADVEKSPRLVVIDPRVAFGRPVIRRHREEAAAKDRVRACAAPASGTVGANSILH
jgi:hypothetical protein